MDIQPQCKALLSKIRRDICSHAYAHELYRYIIQNDAKLDGYRATYQELQTKNLDYFTQKGQRNNADKIQQVYGNSVTSVKIYYFIYICLLIAEILYDLIFLCSKTGIYFVPTNAAVIAV